MKYLMYILMFIAINLYAENNLPYNHQIPSANQQAQKEINSKKDFIELANTLKQVISYGDYSQALTLGLLYMNNYPFQKPDLKKAKYYLELAFQHKIELAAIPLSYIYNPYKSIETLDKGLKTANQKEKLLLILRELEIVLNKLYFNKDLVKHSIKQAMPILKQTDNPILKFAVAHLFFILRDINTANYYLNAACTAHNISNDLKKMCLNDPFVQRREK